jgi:DNA-binding XRE family transcriptional regulator
LTAFLGGDRNMLIMATLKGNKLVSKKRGAEWKAKLIQGKKDALVNPTKLKVTRANKAVSQRELAKAIGVSLATFGGIERGKRTTSKEAAAKIASKLKLPVGKLFKANEKERYVAL